MPAQPAVFSSNLNNPNSKYYYFASRKCRLTFHNIFRDWGLPLIKYFNFCVLLGLKSGLYHLLSFNQLQVLPIHLSVNFDDHLSYRS